jgi:class 3 adenylate cyclase
MPDRVWTWRWLLKSSPEQLWPALSNTDRINRIVGLPEVRFRSFPLARGARREGNFKILGMDITWDEFPFVFVAPKTISVLRRYHNGPLLEMESTSELRPVGTGTEIVHTIRAKPRYFGARAISWFQIGILTHRGFDRAYRSIDAALVAGAAPHNIPAALGESYRPRLRGALGDLEHGELLLEHLVNAPDDALLHMRPFRLGKQWGLPRDRALKLFLQATHKGVLDAAWTLICPHCRGFQDDAKSLRELAFDAHCDSCNVDFEGDFDRLTELTFHLGSRWNTLDVATYCVGGPGSTPHAVAQFRLAPHSTTRFEVTLPPGAFQFRSSLAEHNATFEVLPGNGASHTEVLLDASGLRLGETAVTGRCTFALRNGLDLEATVAIERTAWADDCCPASYVAAFQEYRDLFGKDVLAPGVAVKVASVAILFTDLKGSTALYQQSGDSKAFGLVRDHFDLLTEVVRRHEGAVVKTIGDAVMAAFSDPANAVRAAFAMHQAVAHLRTPAGDAVVLKVGLHAGPCFAVTLSERLDYFGTTVNLAARIQNESQGGDVVMSSELAAVPAIAALLEGRQALSFAASLKGIEGERLLSRISVALPH